jgi:hypothetical protein
MKFTHRRIAAIRFLLAIMTATQMAVVNAAPTQNFPELRTKVAKYMKSRSVPDYNALALQMKLDAKNTDLLIEQTISNTQRSEEIVRNTNDYIIRSEVKAGELKEANELGRSLLSIIEPITKPITPSNLNTATEYYKSHYSTQTELNLPEYHPTAFNTELAKAIQIRAKLYFYY